MKAFLTVSAFVLSTLSATALVQAEDAYRLDSYAYAMIDADDDNLMTIDELQAAIPTITAADLARIDADDDGVIGFDEFSASPVIVGSFDAGSVLLPETRTVSVRRSYFTGIDRNRNGLIEEDELIEVSPAITREIYVSMDEDEDDALAYDELYGSEWFIDALDAGTIIVPAYVARYYAPQTL